MGKRSSFKRFKADNYPTIDPRAVVPLIPHLKPGVRYGEPCAGAGDLIRLLEPHGVACAWASDLDPRADGIFENDALQTGLGAAEIFLTNPPWSRGLLHPLIVHLSNQAPTWLLFDSNWANTIQAGRFMERCRKVVAVGRLIWIPGTKMTGKDDVSWYLFDRPIAGSAPLFYGRGCVPVESPRKTRRICPDCGAVIDRFGKWRLRERNGSPTPVHVDCRDPALRLTAAAEPAPLFDWGCLETA